MGQQNRPRVCRKRRQEMENKFKVIIFLLVFFLLFNVAGNWIVNSSLIENPQDKLLLIENLRLKMSILK